MGAQLTEVDFANLRHRMVEEQLRPRGISDPRVLAAMESVPRHLFVPPAERRVAYGDGPLPIGLGQTISQPYIVACMTERLLPSPDARVLEIGTGSGYQAAVLAEVAGNVWTIERHAELARRAADLLNQLGYTSITVITGDGTHGFPGAAPYDGILVAAAAPHVPKSLRDQLAVGGRMVIPIASGRAQDLRLIERLPEPPPGPSVGRTQSTAPSPRFRETSILACVFVPLVGEEGYSE